MGARTIRKYCDATVGNVFDLDDYYLTPHRKD